MPTCIAKRELLFSLKGESGRQPFAIRVFAPHLASGNSTHFDGTAYGCTWEITGLPEPVSDTAYGADSLQALQFASDLDGVLQSLRDKYDFYFPTGEAYFG